MGSLKLVEPFGKRRGTSLWAGFPAFVLLAIDPGDRATGWAVYDAEKSLIGCGLGDPHAERADLIVIELPQVYPQQQVPPNDLIALAFLAGRYAGVGMGSTKGPAEVYTVLPHEWKGNLPKDLCAIRVRAALMPAERNVVDACELPEKQRHNMLDAIGIGLFTLGRRF